MSRGLATVKIGQFVPETSEADDLIHVLASSIRQARSQRKMTQAELAEKMNTSQPAIARLESGDLSSIRNYFDALKALRCRFQGTISTIVPESESSSWYLNDGKD